jgi:hypothetical protein
VYDKLNNIWNKESEKHGKQTRQTPQYMMFLLGLMGTDLLGYMLVGFVLEDCMNV